MLRVVLDTNVIISGTIMSYGHSFHILNAWRENHFTLITSMSILQELNQVFHYPHIQLKRNLTEEDIKKTLSNLWKYGTIVPEKTIVRVIAEDTDDDKFLVSAIEGEAKYIVSGDIHLLNLSNYNEIEIVTPARFREILKAENPFIRK